MQALKKKPPSYENVFMKLNTAKFGNSNAFNSPFLDTKHIIFCMFVLNLFPVNKICVCKVLSRRQLSQVCVYKSPRLHLIGTLSPYINPRDFANRTSIMQGFHSLIIFNLLQFAIVKVRFSRVSSASFLLFESLYTPSQSS